MQILSSFDEQERGYLLETDLLNSLDVTDIGEVMTFFDRVRISPRINCNGTNNAVSGW